MAVCRGCGSTVEFREAATREGKVYWERLDPGGAKHHCVRNDLTVNKTVPNDLKVSIVPEPIKDSWTGDKWDQLANQHLFAYVVRRMNVAKYGPRSTAILLEHKRAWSQQMRDYLADNAFPADHGKSEWIGCMARAEEQIARERAAAKAPKTQAA